jgi:hypothetical protein
VSDNVEKRLETDIYIYIYRFQYINIYIYVYNDIHLQELKNRVFISPRLANTPAEIRSEFLLNSNAEGRLCQ